MKGRLLLISFIVVATSTHAQKKPSRKLINGIYLQWGYNADAYTHSTIHFKMANGNDFKLHRAKAHDSGDFDAIYKEPMEISIPQYNYRIGFYINERQT